MDWEEIVRMQKKSFPTSSFILLDEGKINGKRMGYELVIANQFVKDMGITKFIHYIKLEMPAFVSCALKGHRIEDMVCQELIEQMNLISMHVIGTNDFSIERGETVVRIDFAYNMPCRR